MSPTSGSQIKPLASITSPASNVRRVSAVAASGAVSMRRLLVDMITQIV